MSRDLHLELTEEQILAIAKILGFDELKGRIRRLEDALVKIQRQLKDYGVPLPFYDPYKFCQDHHDRRIIDILFTSGLGLSTSEIADKMGDIDRWFVLRRLKRMEETFLNLEGLTLKEPSKRSIFIREGHKWALNRELLM